MAGIKERRNISCLQKWERQHSSAWTVVKPSKPSTPRAASRQASTCHTALSAEAGIRGKLHYWIEFYSKTAYEE